MSPEDIIRELIPHAKAASRGAAYRHGVDPDDTFQTIMLESWQHLLTEPEMDNPVGYMRDRMKYSIGHAIQTQKVRFGNSKTDQFKLDEFGNEMEIIDEHQQEVDPLQAAALAIALMGAGPDVSRIFHDIYIVGHSREEVAKAMGLSKRTVQEKALKGLNTAFEAVGMEPPKQRLRRDTHVYLFVHEDGTEARVTRKGLEQEYGVRSSAVADIMKGKKRNGWKLG